jgi:uncharacterized protein YcsI (UPF0317 family)
MYLGGHDLIGIPDIRTPRVVETSEVREDEIPLFWACGVTPQSVALDARLPLVITHTPGHMLVTDLKNADLALG